MTLLHLSRKLFYILGPVRTDFRPMFRARGPRVIFTIELLCARVEDCSFDDRQTAMTFETVRVGLNCSKVSVYVNDNDGVAFSYTC